MLIYDEDQRFGFIQLLHIFYQNKEYYDILKTEYQKLFESNRVIIETSNEKNDIQDLENDQIIIQERL